MTDHDSGHRDLLEGSKQLFDASVDGIDAATAARLRAARLRALEPAGRASWAVPLRLWFPAAAAAAVLAVWLVPGQEYGTPVPERGFATVAATDLEILLAEEELEMLAEFEFYEWLDVEDGAAAGDEASDGIG
jgi:hypothetical protein